jgi:hypothetical protein
VRKRHWQRRPFDPVNPLILSRNSAARIHHRLTRSGKGLSRQAGATDLRPADGAPNPLPHSRGFCFVRVDRARVPNSAVIRNPNEQKRDHEQEQEQEKEKGWELRGCTFGGTPLFCAPYDGLAPPVSHSRLPMDFVAAPFLARRARVRLPISSHLLGVFSRGGGKARGAPGELARAEANRTLPSLGWERRRPGAGAQSSPALGGTGL